VREIEKIERGEGGKVRKMGKIRDRGRERGEWEK